MCVIVTTMDTFGIWILEELEDRGWSMSELARRSGVTHATISRIVSGERNPSAKMCVAIARALKMQSEEVMRLAGLLPSKPDETLDIERALYLFNQLSPTQRKIILAQMRVLADMEPEEDEAGQRLEPGTAPA